MNKTIFYGAGKNCLSMLNIFVKEKFAMPQEIWDIEAESKEEIKGVTVVSPKFNILLSDDSDKIAIIITIANKFISEGLKRRMLEVNPKLNVLTFDDFSRFLRYRKIAQALE